MKMYVTLDDAISRLSAAGGSLAFDYSAGKTFAHGRLCDVRVTLPGGVEEVDEFDENSLRISPDLACETISKALAKAEGERR